MRTTQDGRKGLPNRSIWNDHRHLQVAYADHVLRLCLAKLVMAAHKRIAAMRWSREEACLKATSPALF